MCVIAYVSKSTELSEKEFRNCFVNNPDGAGFMIYDDKKKKVHIRKGFMNFDDFWNAVKDLPTDRDRVFHFRIATSGKISPECCHPFVLSSNLETMRETDVFTDMGFSHNGVMSDFTPKEGMLSPYSDTMYFGAQVLFPLKDKLYKESTQYLIKKAMGTNKYAILGKNGAIILGAWKTSPETGIQYSNTSYEERKSTYYYGGCGYTSYTTYYEYEITPPVGEPDWLTSFMKAVDAYGNTIIEHYIDGGKHYVVLDGWVQTQLFNRYGLKYSSYLSGYKVPKAEEKVKTTYTMVKCIANSGKTPMNQEKMNSMMEFIESEKGSVWDLTENTKDKSCVFFVTNFPHVSGSVNDIFYSVIGTVKGVYDDKAGTVRLEA